MKEKKNSLLFITMHTALLHSFIKTSVLYHYFCPDKKSMQKGFIKLSKQALIGYLISFLVFSSVAGLFLFNPWSTKTAEAAWFNDNWSYRKTLTFTHNATVSSPSKVKFDVDTTDAPDKFQADCGDVRFTSPNGDILPYYYDSAGGACDTSSTDFYVLIPSIINGSNYIYIYYGNPSVVNGTEAANFSDSTTTPSGGAATAGTEEKAPSPVAYWKFDDGQGTTAQDSASGNWDGTLTNSPTWKTEDQCISNKCISFDGSNDFVDAGNITSVNSLSSMTVSLWFKMPDLGTNRGLIAKADYQTQDSWAIQTDNSNDDELRMFVFNNVSTDPGDNNIQTTNANLTTSTWYHLEAVYDGSESNANRIKFYLNGRLLTTSVTGTIPTSLTAASSTVKIGKFGGSLDRYFKGIIDEPKIYNYARSSAQVLADFNSRSNPEGLSTQLGNNTGNMPSILSSNLAAYWPMDESSGTTVADQTGNGRTGTATNGPAVAAGKFGNSRDFDGSDDYVSTGFNALFTATNSQVTISAWVKTTDSGRADVLTYYGGSPNFFGYGLVINPGFGSCSTAGSVALWVGDATNGYICTTDTVNDGNWHHLVGTFDGTTGKIYIDGRLSTSNTRSNGVNYNDPGLVLRIGSDTGPVSYMDGSIDDVRVYTKTFSANDVLQLYNWAPGPVGYWQMNESSWNGTSGEVKDSSGSGNNGTASGGATTTNAKFNKGGNFDGANDYVNLGTSDNLNLSQAMSVSAWVKFDAIDSTYRDMLTKADNSGCNVSYEFGIGNDNLLYLGWTGNSSCSFESYQATGFTPVANTWYHLVATRNAAADTVYIYVNGVKYTTSLAPFTGDQTPNNNGAIGTSIGSTGECACQFFDGTIDDLKLYNYERTSAQVISDMNAGHPAPGSPVGTPIGHWKLDEGYGDTVVNIGNGGSAYNGNLSGSCPGGSTCPNWTNDGKFGKALMFVGADNETIDAGDITSLDSATEFTMSAWAKKTDLGQFIEIGKYTDDNNRIGIELWGDGVAYFHAANGGAAYGYTATTRKEGLNSACETAAFCAARSTWGCSAFNACRASSTGSGRFLRLMRPVSLSALCCH